MPVADFSLPQAYPFLPLSFSAELNQAKSLGAANSKIKAVVKYAWTHKFYPAAPRKVKSRREAAPRFFPALIPIGIFRAGKPF